METNDLARRCEKLLADARSADDPNV